jgi:hypothetical protein
MEVFLWLPSAVPENSSSTAGNLWKGDRAKEDLITNKELR